MLSVTTDYACDKGSPEPYLRRIAEAGFSHVHWCHQWNTDFFYCDSEVAQIGRWMREYGLALCDLHASSGVEKGWNSLREYERAAGVELVVNRMEMTARLGSDVVILHMGNEPGNEEAASAYWDQVFRSLDELEPHSRRLGVRIAIENGVFPQIRKVFEHAGPEFVGLCYDAGHGNLLPDGLEQLEAVKDRLLAVHLHDNDGTRDFHHIPFDGNIDWPRLMRILAASAYKKCVSCEANVRNMENKDETAFLTRTFAALEKLQGILDEERGAGGGQS